MLWPLSCSGRAARWLARTQRKATVARCEAACEAVNQKLAMGGTGSARVPPHERSCPREPDAQAAHRLRSAHAELSTLTVTELPQASRSFCELRPRVKARPTLQGPCPRATAIERARCAAGSLTRPCSHTVCDMGKVYADICAKPHVAGGLTGRLEAACVAQKAHTSIC